MKRSLLLFCMLSTLWVNAQVKRFSFKAGANYPIIPTEYVKQKLTTLPLSSGFSGVLLNVGTLSLSHESKPGFDLGGSIDYSISKKFFLSSGLNLSYLRFQKSVKIEELSTNEFEMDGNLATPVPVGTPFGSITFIDLNGNDEPSTNFLGPTDDNGKTTMLYIQAPVLLGTTFFHDKLIVRAGVTFSYLISASQYVDKYSFTNQQIESHKETGRNGYTALLASCTVNTTYMITRALGIDISANQFLSPIYDQSDTAFKSKYTTVSAGLSYNINH